MYLVGAQAFKPETSFLVKIDVSNVDAEDPTPISFEFDVTIVDFCKDSALSFTSSQADIDYVIDAVPTTAAQTITFPSVTTTTDSTRCPISVDLQIYLINTWVDYVGNTANYPWIDSASYLSNTGFDVQTDDASTYANPANSQVIFNCRVIATDPDSTSSSAIIYSTFAVSFASACESDAISQATLIADQVSLVTSSSTTADYNAETRVHSVANCPETFIWEHFDSVK